MLARDESWSLAINSSKRPVWLFAIEISLSLATILVSSWITYLQMGTAAAFVAMVACALAMAGWSVVWLKRQREVLTPQVIVTPEHIQIRQGGHRAQLGMLKRLRQHWGGLTLEILADSGKTRSPSVRMQVWRDSLTSDQYRRLVLMLHWHLGRGNERA